MSTSSTTLISDSVGPRQDVLRPLGTDPDSPFTESYTWAPNSCFILTWSVGYNAIGSVPRVIIDGQLCRSTKQQNGKVVYVGDEKTRQEICAQLKLTGEIFPTLSHMASEIFVDIIPTVTIPCWSDGSIKSPASILREREVFSKRCGTLTRALATLLAISISKAKPTTTAATQIVVAKPTEWDLVTKKGNRRTANSHLKRYTSGFESGLYSAHDAWGKGKANLTEVERVQLCFRNKEGSLVWVGGDYSAPSRVQSQDTEQQSNGATAPLLICNDEAGDLDFTIGTDHEGGSTLPARQRAHVNAAIRDSEIPDELWNLLQTGGGCNF